MSFLIRNSILYFRLFWNHIVFWSFPTLEESYYTNIGLIYFKLDKYIKAKNAFEKSQESHNNQDASFSKFNWFYLGYCYLNLGDFTSAIRNFENYLKFDNRNVEVLQILGWCYELTNDLETALKSYFTILDIEPDLKELHIECSKILMDLNRKEEAIDQLKIAETKIEDHIEAKILHSILLKYNGNIEKSIEVLKSTISEMENEPKIPNHFFKNDIHILLSRCQKESGDLKGALSTLESSYKKEPNDLWLINELAMEYADQNIKLEDALNLIESVLKFQPCNSIFIDTKGWILFQLDKKKEAAELFKNSLELNPNYKDAKKHYQLASKHNKANSADAKSRAAD